jgi:NADPH:quinone reductase-like Zn-dependent oxidoreductase
MLAEAMRETLGWIVSGALVVPPVTTFKLDDVRAAHAALESGATVGKLVLEPP